MSAETQTWWLSFADPDLPEGHQFLGVAVVDVTTADADAAHAYVTARRASFGLPPADRDTDWMAAAMRKAHRLGCNPGGQIAAIRLDNAPRFGELDALTPRDRLLSRAEIDRLKE